MKVYDIATKVIATDDEDDEIEFAIKASVENQSDDKDVFIELQGVDADGFEVETVFLEGRIAPGEQKTLTTKETIDKALFEQIVNWQFKN